MKTLTAAIQFGSSRICAAAAWRDEAGRYEVAAIESATTSGCIRHGCVASVDDTAARIKSLMQKLSNRVKPHGGQLDCAYVGICGMSMHSMSHNPSTIVTGEPEITDEVMYELRNQSLQLSMNGMDILGLESGNYDLLNGQEVVGHHQLIVAEKRLKQGYKAAMDRANVRIAGFVATPLQLSDLLTEDERQQGAVIVDLGHSLTTVVIYAEGTLQHLAVIPLGSDTVTRDIMTKGIRREDAEAAKLNWSDASQTVPDKDKTSLINGLPISGNDLNTITVCRYEEIAANVQNQIKIAGFEGKLPGGCIITGGASMQKGLTTLLRNRLGVSTICTRSCSSIQFSNSQQKPYLASLMTMLQACTLSCESDARLGSDYNNSDVQDTQVVIRQRPKSETRSQEKQEKGKRRSGLRNFLGDLFSGLDDDQE